MDIIHSTNLVPFLIAALALNLTPGADMAYVATVGAQRGWQHGALAAIGIGAGCIGHVLLAAFGVSALVALSPILFTILKILGAAYLLWFAFKLMRGDPTGGSDTTIEQSAGKVFRDGVLINLLNPKVGVFFIAFLPQFSDPAAGKIWLQMIFLGLFFTISGTLVNLGVGTSAAWVSRHVAGYSRVARAARLLAATVIGALAIRLLATSR